jgi:hypothetical protein
MPKPIEVKDVRFTTAMATPTTSGRLSAGSTFVAGVVLGAWLAGGWSCDNHSSAGSDSSVVQQQKSADK